MEFIILDTEFEHRIGPHNIIKSVLVNERGEPILRKNLIVQITDAKIADELNGVTETEQLERLPDIGELVTAGVLYPSEWGILKCRQTHNRTIYDPIDVPALFSFYRENPDEVALEWIQGEYVYVGWGRIYDGITYTVIQEHQTQSDWTPPATPTLWESNENPGSEIPVWKQPTGAHDAYAIGDQVHFPTIDDPVYESLISANVWSPTGYPAGWKQI